MTISARLCNTFSDFFETVILWSRLSRGFSDFIEILPSSSLLSESLRRFIKIRFRFKTLFNYIWLFKVIKLASFQLQYSLFYTIIQSTEIMRFPVSLCLKIWSDFRFDSDWCHKFNFPPLTGPFATSQLFFYCSGIRLKYREISSLFYHPKV